LAFTRNPSDTSVSPATYTADGASDLLLVDQQRDIAIDGSDEKDLIFVSATALASNALYNFDVRGFAGKDTIDIRANLIQNSTINGNIGADTMYAGYSALVGDAVVAGAITNLSGSYFLGGKDNDKMFGYGLNNGEINGNIGDDNLTINNLGVVAGYNMYVGGGQGNDVVDVFGGFTNSIIDGNKGIDTINLLGGTHTGTSVNGGEGNDIIRELAINDTKGLMLNGDKGNDSIIALGDFASTLTGGEGNDTIVSFAIAGQAGTIDAGVGADTLVITGAGAENIVFNQGDSVAATKTNLGTEPFTALTDGGTITFGNSVDNFAGFITGTDKIDIDFKPASALIDGNTSFNTANLEPDEITQVQGSFDSNVFTVGTAATDIDFLYVVGGQNITLGQIFTNSSSMFVSEGTVGGATGALAITDFV